MAAIELDTVRGSRRRERDFTAEENEPTTTTTVKRRKVEEEVESRIILSPCVQATNRNSAGASETSVVIVRRRDSPVVDDQIHSSGDEDLDRDSSSVTCFSSNRSQEKSKRRIDFDENNNGAVDQIETSWIYDNFFNKRNDPYSESVNYMEIQASEDVDVESRRRLRMKKKEKKSRDTVKEAELEDFFQTAEKDLRNKMLECSRKYNFDFEKEEPLGGRFEWVKLNP